MIAVLCLAITLLAYFFISSNETARQELEFERQATRLASILQSQLDRDLEIVRSIGSFYSASEYVSRGEFRKFVERTLDRSRQIKALEWIPLVPAGDRKAYERRAREEGLDSFRITERDENGNLVPAAEGRDEYFPVYYVEPLAGNEEALGFDLGSEPMRRAALDRARVMGRSTVTAPITLVQERGVQIGILIFHPLYHPADFEGADGGRVLHGFALGVLHMGDLLQLILPELDKPTFLVSLVDVTEPHSPQILVDRMSPAGDADVPQGSVWVTGRAFPINVPGRTWNLYVKRAPANFGWRNIPMSQVALAFGLLLTGLVGVYLFQRTRTVLNLRSLEGDLSRKNIELERGLAEKERATEAMLRSEARFGAIFELGHFAMTVCDRQGHILTLNQACERMLGYGGNELEKIHFRDLTHPDDREESMRLFDHLIAGEVPRFEVEKRYLRKDGRVIWCHTGVSAICDELGDVEATIAILVDISNRKAAEEERENLRQQLVHRQKMEAIGRLAGGVAHDFNNLLTVLRGYTSLLRDKLAGVDPVAEYVGEIDRTTDRAEELTRQLLAFGRKQVMRPRVLSLNRVVADLEPMLGRLIGEDVELVTAYDSDPLRILFDQGQMEQVIMNLAVNARDAMPGGGRLLIRTERDGAGAPPGRARLVMEDTGEGMDAETMERVFEPFFTTKEVGEGTGLGLATVYGILNQGGGDIIVSSEPGRGSTFTVGVPLTDQAQVEDSGVDLVPPVSGGRETILLVEDEDMVRKVALQTLEGLGYRVLEAGNGEQAQMVCKKFGGVIDLVLTDVVMPGMSGPDLVERLRPGCSVAKVIFMSGYAGGQETKERLIAEGDLFLQKPFSPEVLGREVRRVLDRA